MNDRLQIFVLSYGRRQVPSLKYIADKSAVIVLTSEDNPCKNDIELQGARLMVFDKEEFRGRGLEMLNEESVQNKRSALYGYNKAIEWGRQNGVRFVLVLDDDYIGLQAPTDRHTTRRLWLDKWAAHAVSFMSKHKEIAATCAVNLGQLLLGLASAFYMNLRKRQLMNTIIFNTDYRHDFISLGNGDYVCSLMHNCASTDLVVRLQTIIVCMETINHKKHVTVDYSNLFYSRWSAVMAQPAYARVDILRGGGKSIMSSRFNTVLLSNGCPKIVSL